MKRKAVSLVLALTMVASVVAGCGSKQEAATTEPAAEETTEAAEDTTAADTADAAADAAGDADLYHDSLSRAVVRRCADRHICVPAA